MTRRASLPGVDELFRTSREPAGDTEEDQVIEAISLQVTLAEPSPMRPEDQDHQVMSPPVVAGAALAGAPEPSVSPGASPENSPGPDAGRRAPRHEEKVTFYCTAEDLTRIERARLALRSEHRLASDRGRIVRAALAEILDDFEARGGQSALVARLRGRDTDQSS